MRKNYLIFIVSFWFLATIIIIALIARKSFFLSDHLAYLTKREHSTQIIYLSNYDSRHLSPIISPFNHREVTLNDVERGYSFLAGGHLLSPKPADIPAAKHISLEPQPAEIVTLSPSINLLNNMKMINSHEAKFFVGLGDIFYHNQQNQVQEFLKSFAYKLEMPFFNAPGNHDLWPDPVYYRDLFGKTYFDFQIRHEKFIFLNTNRRGDPSQPSDIDFEQLEYFMELIRQIEKDNSIKHVFIFTHQNIWLDDPSIGGISEQEMGFNFYDTIEAELLNIPKQFYWISGNPMTEGIGFVYHKKHNSNTTYINTNITCRPDDTLLLVEITPDKSPIFTPISLTNKEMQPIESYSLEYVRNR